MSGLDERLDQIRRTAHRVTPTDVGRWSLATRPGVADGVVIAPADLAWLLALAAQVQAPEPQGGGLKYAVQAGLIVRAMHVGGVPWEEAERLLNDLIAARAVPAETLADRVRALADEWDAEGASLIEHCDSARDVHEGTTLQGSARTLRRLLDPAEQPATREDGEGRS